MSRDVTNDEHGNTLTTAEQLSADLIGVQIRVRTWDNNSEIATVQTGELRQLGATADRVWVIIGVGAETKVTLMHDQPVSIRPPKDYTDVVTLAEYDGSV